MFFYELISLLFILSLDTKQTVWYRDKKKKKHSDYFNLIFAYLNYLFLFSNWFKILLPISWRFMLNWIWMVYCEGGNEK